MDRLKFRVWDKANEVMKYDITGDLVLMYGTWNRLMENIDTAALMQCTGLKDKTGTLIYEGDIVRYQLCVTKENNPVFMHQEVEFVYNIYKPYGITWNRSEIIGNKHENPELLKEASEL